MDNWKSWVNDKNLKPYILSGIIILFALPFTLLLVKNQTENRSHAASPDQLETEAGVLSSSGVSKQSDTNASGGQYTLFSQSSLTPTGTPTPSPANLKSVTVSSITALKNALLDNTIDEIVVTNGTYHVSPSNQTASDSLWIGSAASGGYAFNARTRPVTVRAQTTGGVTFDGGGAKAFGALSFEDGAHDQTWDGFRFTNMVAEYTGIIEVGGYSPRRPPYNITIRNMTITSSCTGRATTNSGSTWDHGVYLAHATGSGPHDILIENLTVDGRGNLASAVHWDHGDATNPASHHVTVRNMNVIGTQSAIIPWVDGLHDILIDGAQISDTRRAGVQFESNGASNIVFKNVVSIRSGVRGWDSSMGLNPPGVTFINSSFN